MFVEEADYVRAGSRDSLEIFLHHEGVVTRQVDGVIVPLEDRDSHGRALFSFAWCVVSSRPVVGSTLETLWRRLLGAHEHSTLRRRLAFDRRRLSPTLED